MTKYRYEKYNINKTWSAETNSSSSCTIPYTYDYQNFYSSYSYSDDAGYTISGCVNKQWGAHPPNPAYMWVSNTENKRAINFITNITINDSVRTISYILNTLERDLINTKGSFVANIIGDENQCPTDGIQDGYWYVRTTKILNEFLIKQNNQYYSVKDNALTLLGTPADDTQKEKWFNDNGVDDLKAALLVPDSKGSKLIDKLDDKFEIRMMKAKG